MPFRSTNAWEFRGTPTCPELQSTPPSERIH
ncbi:hypothetical protein FOYG_01051 [Fusarium oxysporum NRRL 32931]|uniref:Uncharacterized protein n=1 Tax=Fusarium oxysporum NRRL 32931 TaxID=660029 RepID=W9J9Q9_FUSOX|nr:hypothetical protein FOYG_01051 [Fusarium oxysporum NRRL 32931]